MKYLKYPTMTLASLLLTASPALAKPFLSDSELDPEILTKIASMFSIFALGVAVYGMSKHFNFWKMAGVKSLSIILFPISNLLLMGLFIILVDFSPIFGWLIAANLFLVLTGVCLFLASP